MVKRFSARPALFLGGVLFLLMGASLFAQTGTVRQNETDAFNEIKAALDEKKTEYEEVDMLAECGVFGKSIIVSGGTAAEKENPIKKDRLIEKNNAAPKDSPESLMFLFPVSGGYRDLAFSLIEGIKNSTVPVSVVFLGDAWAPSKTSFRHLVERFDNPENALLMSLEVMESASLAVTFFQGLVKNPFHLTAAFAESLEDRNIRFSFLDKTVMLPANAFSDTEKTASFLLGFAETNPRPQTDPDIFYIAADFQGRKLMLANASIMKITLLGSAFFLFFNLFFAVIFNKKRVFIIVLTVFFVSIGVLLLNNPLRARPDAVIAENVPYSGGDSADIPFAADTNDEYAVGEPKVDVKKTAFLDRFVYAVKVECADAPFRITISYDFHDREESTLPGEVYEPPFPYEIEDGRVTFILGEYPPNPFAAQISFPRTSPGLLSIAASFAPDEPASSVWQEKQPAAIE